MALCICYINCNRIEILHALKKMRKLAFCETIILLAFWMTSIFPHNHNTVLKQLPDNDVKIPELETVQDSHTTGSSIPTIPTFTQAQKSYVLRMQDRELGSSIQTLLAPLQKDVVAIATSETLDYQ